MGRNKFCLTARKNAERKRYAAATTTTTPLIVSIPRVKLSVHDLASLQSQLSSALVSSPWTLTSVCTDEGRMQKIALCVIDTDREPPVLRLSITIREDFSWALGVYGQVADPELCRALSNVPSSVNCTDKVLQFTSLIEGCTICVGNSDDKFMEVANRRDGIFKDHSGKR